MYICGAIAGQSSIDSPPLPDTMAELILQLDPGPKVELLSTSAQSIRRCCIQVH